MAAAARKNGYSCEELQEALATVGCAQKNCADQIEAVDQGLEALSEDAQAVLDALEELLASLGLPRRSRAPDEKNKEEETPWWQELISKLNVVAKAWEIGAALSELFSSVDALNATIKTLLADVKGLMQCSLDK